MPGETVLLLGTGLGACLVSVLIGWTVLVFFAAGRRRWRALDPLVVALLIECLLRQLVITANSSLKLFRPESVHWCAVLLWFSSSLTILQGATLASLSIGSLMRSSLRYKRAVTKSHLSYHLICLATLSACTGVAAVLSRTQPCLTESDPRYTLFSLTLRTFLTITSCLGLLLLCCCHFPLPKKTVSSSSKQHLTGSSSDLSSSTVVSDLSRRHYLVYPNRYCINDDKIGDEGTYVSTTSSTNSRAFLANKPVQELPKIVTVALVFVGLATNHLPLLGMDYLEILIPEGEFWKLEELTDWSGLLEGLLLPLVLALCDRAFLDRVARVYTRPKPPDLTRPPHGPYGKFLPRGSMMQHRTPIEQVRFPITNGTLFASLDGRLPVIHRRPKGKSGTRSPPPVVEQLRQFLANGIQDLDMMDDKETMQGDYSSLSRKSACSATTTANDDFEFFQHKSASTETMIVHPEPPIQPKCNPNKDPCRQLFNNSSNSNVNNNINNVKYNRSATPQPFQERNNKCHRPSVASALAHVRRQQINGNNLTPVLSMDSLVAALNNCNNSNNNNSNNNIRFRRDSVLSHTKRCPTKWESVPDLKSFNRCTDYP